MSEESGTANKMGTIFLWLITIVFGVAMAGAGATKFIMSDMWTGFFAGWGYPAWFGYVVGVVEMAAAVTVLVPKFATYAGSMIVVVMVAAAGTVLTHPGDMTATVPIINIVVFSTVAYARRGVRWKPS